MSTTSFIKTFFYSASCLRFTKTYSRHDNLRYNIFTETTKNEQKNSKFPGKIGFRPYPCS